MILEFSISNFRSIQEKQTFTMVASSSRSKSGNTFDISLTNGDTVKLIKTAAIYGANGSGKSNFIRALFEIRKFIVNSKEITVDMPIPAYDPFLFNTSTINQLSEFEIIFITLDKNKFQYKISFNKNEIVEESLYHFPEKKSQNIFLRGQEKKEADSNIHIAKLGKNLGYKKYEVFKKIPFLSFFGKAENYHTLITPVYSYFNELEIWNATSTTWVSRLANYIKEELQKSENNSELKQLEELICTADSQIQSLQIDYDKKIKENETITTDENKTINKVRQNEVLYGEHKVFEKHKEISTHNLPFYNESFGTNKLFALGGLIIKILNKGGVIFFDELDTSMHPILSSLLIRIFQENHHSNSQLVFTTHETFLLIKEFRTDQIWFAQKNTYGETEIFSAQDFEGVREEIPFEKWYLAGKFGAIPKIDAPHTFITNGEKETI